MQFGEAELHRRAGHVIHERGSALDRNAAEAVAMSSFPKARWYRAVAEEVSPRAFQVGFLLVERFLFPSKSDCWATHETLGRLAKASPRTVREALAELEEAGFITHRRGGKGHANRYMPVLFDRQNFADQNEEGEAFDRQNLAAVDRRKTADEIPTQRPEKGGGPWAPADVFVSTSKVVDQGSASSPPKAPEGAVGDDAAPADAMSKPSSTGVPPASTLEERIARLESLLDDYRDPATGELQPDMPAIVRDFYMRDEDPTLFDFAAIASAFSQWRSGDWVEPATDDEMLAEHLRRHAVYGRDQREDDEITWDQAEPDEDDDANPLIAAAPTRR